MNTGRTPACNTSFSPAQGKNITGASKTQNDNILSFALNQPKKSGNRCGHDKNNFKHCRFPKSHRLRSHAIEEALRRLRKYEDFPCIYKLTSLLHWHLQIDGGRKRRSESREAIVPLVLSALLKGINLITMEYGYYDSANIFINYNYKEIIKTTGISLSRIKAAMKQLQKLNLCSVKVIPKEIEKEKYITEKVIITLSIKIFEMLELIDEYLQDRAYATTFHHKKALQLEERKSFLKNYYPEKEIKKKEESYAKAFVKGTGKGRAKFFTEAIGKAYRKTMPNQEQEQEQEQETTISLLSLAADQNKSPP